MAKPALGQFEWQTAVRPEEVQVIGDRAYVHGAYDLATTPTGEGKEFEATAKSLTILHRQIDGSWEIAIDCFNCGAPLD